MYAITLKNKNTSEIKEKTFKNIIEFKHFVKEQIDMENDDKNDSNIEYEIKAIYEFISINNEKEPVLLYTALNKVGSLWWDELYEYLT